MKIKEICNPQLVDRFLVELFGVPLLAIGIVILLVESQIR